MTETISEYCAPVGLPDTWFDQRTTMRAWEDLLTYRDLERTRSSGIRHEILESWSRSLELGIDALADFAPLDITEERLAQARQDSAALRAASHMPFSKIGPLLVDADALLILTDANGLILDQIGDCRTRDAAEAIHLIQGGTWDEAAIGTNGIGTALRSAQPVVVHASEHFCQGIKAWTCAAAPIRDPVDQRVLGAVDLSGPPGIFRPHNLALAAAVAREIEIALAERHEVERGRLLEAFLDTDSARMKNDSVIILDRIGRVMYHRPAPAARSACDFQIGRQLLTLSDKMSDGDILKAMPPHMRPTGVNRLLLDGRFSGAVLTLPGKTHVAATTPPTPARIEPRAGTGEEALLMIGNAPKFLEAMALARRAAAAGAPVLIQGETGVGKELFARLVHAEAGRKPGSPFVTVNCGAISADLFGSELFGHIAGAFTGASREGKPGKFELADGGVLCLDEIGEMPLDLQPYLLRVLEQRAIYRVGCSRRRPVDVQLVAMTNRDLGCEVETGRFRRDLFYRIGTVTIEVPPLRERICDIPLLADHYNQRVATRLRREPLVLDAAAMDCLMAYRWPGNVRELRNLFERLHLMVTDGRVTRDDLSAPMRAQPEPTPSAQMAEADPVSLTDMECQAIKRALASEGGNMTRVAAALGISRPTLYRKLKLYGIRRVYE
ncbi:Transcriptional regulator of acetoin/glycerol metabolism [Gemmobacter aquatilis]|uniref:Nif-specific regulatory protein n=1 Tax=Gemmobacter aquatilis TaxID=933059 RepID=A0A1H7Z181_9RHOB|nr:sigma-54-dependent Fis family transcriptional regulator [Gemmobacter aquatilis]SEM51965.1 Transcriptional regulator of acetoin/glycerol metabolism [Gemmobacter aquatilis]